MADTTFVPGSVITSAWLNDVNNAIYGTHDVTRHGADKTGAVDSTAAIQAVLDSAGVGATIYFPAGTYRINGTLIRKDGQTIKGEGWAAVNLSFDVQPGSTILKQYSTLDIPLIQVIGADDEHQKEQGGLRDIALVHNTPSSTTGTGYYASFARGQIISNVYMAGFNIGIDQGPQCWQWLVSHVKIMDFHSAGIRCAGSSEDNQFENCQLSAYQPTATCVLLRDQSANNVFTNFYMSAAKNGCIMQQGDTSGVGTGTPYPMFSTWISPLCEDMIEFGWGMISSNENAASSLHPGLTLINPRVYNGGAYATPNNGQTVIYAAHASQIKVDQLYEGGFSYGLSAGVSAYGYFPTGTKIGPVTWGNDNAFTYGTSRFQGYMGSITRIPADKPLIRLTSAALSYTGGNTTRIPFTTVVSDAYNWVNAANQGISPTRAGQTVRFQAKVRTNSMPAGRTLMMLYKNDAQLAILSDTYVTTAGQPHTMQGEFWDIPNGTTDQYYITVNCTGSFTLDNAAGSTHFYAELQGT